MPTLLLYAPQAHYLTPAPENFADGVRVSPCHSTRIVLCSLVLVHVVAHFRPGSSLPKVTAREHELAASASHMKLHVKNHAVARGSAAYPIFQMHAAVKVSHQHDAVHSPPTVPVLLLRTPLSRGGLCTN